MRDFDAQELANTAWAFAMANQSGVHLLRALARVAKQHMEDFNMQDLRKTMTLWALSRRESLKDAWSLLDHAKPIGVSFSPFGVGALLTDQYSDWTAQ